MLGSLRERLEREDERTEVRRLRDRFGRTGSTPIGNVRTRTPVTISGEVRALQVRPGRGSTSLEVTIDDGTGRAVLVFTGRRHITGIDAGRGLVVRGVGRVDRGRLVYLNPAYTLLP